MSELIKRLEATVRIDAVNGDSFERSIVSSQIREAIAEIKLYKGLLEAEQEDCQLQRKNNQAQWERAEIAERDCINIEHATASKCVDIQQVMVGSLIDDDLQKGIDAVRAHFNLPVSP